MGARVSDTLMAMRAGFRTRLVLVAALGAALGAAVLPAASLASLPPVIGAESVSEVSESSAILEAQINPEGLDTTYEFWLQYAACQTNTGGASCDAIVVKKVGDGSIRGTGGAQTVRADLSSLQPGYTYSYWVIASNSAGTKEAPSETFKTLGPAPPGLPGGSGAGAPYESKEEPWVQEGAEREGAEAPRLEEERRAKQREVEERSAKEAAERAVREREAREAGERAGREEAERGSAASRSARCLVPRLKGDSLRIARSALRKAHCRLGSVSRPRGHHGALVVTTQSVRAGHKLAAGTAVAVKLGPAR